MIRVFVDSDVIISSLLSSQGAASVLLEGIKGVKFFISNFSQKELKVVVKRLGIEEDKLDDLLQNKIEIKHLSQEISEIKRDFGSYVFDQNDAHIVVGAKECKADFLVSYNIKHFKGEKMKEDFKIILMTPAMFLQYLRSI